MKNLKIFYFFLIFFPAFVVESLVNPLEIFGNQEKLQENSPLYLSTLARKFLDSSPLKAAHVYSALIKKHHSLEDSHFAQSLNQANQKVLACIFSVFAENPSPDFCQYPKESTDSLFLFLDFTNRLHQLSSSEKEFSLQINPDKKIRPDDKNENNLKTTGLYDYLRFRELVLSSNPDKRAIHDFSVTSMDPFFQCPVSNIQKIYDGKNNLDSCYPLMEFEWLTAVSLQENGLPVQTMKRYFPASFQISALLFEGKNSVPWDFLAKISLLKGSSFFLSWLDKIPDHGTRLYFRSMLEGKKKTDEKFTMIPLKRFTIEQNGLFHPAFQKDLEDISIKIPGTDKISILFGNMDIPFQIHPFFKEIWISKKIASLPSSQRKELMELAISVLFSRIKHRQWPQWLFYANALQDISRSGFIFKNMINGQKTAVFYPMTLSSVAAFPFNENEEQSWWIWLLQVYELANKTEIIKNQDTSLFCQSALKQNLLSGSCP